MAPASDFASTLPPLIGKARLPSGLAVAGAAGAALMPSAASACAAPGSSASEVAPPVKAICPGVALTVAVPMRSPRVKALTPNALFSAAAPLALSATATPVMRVPRPAPRDLALASESVKAVRRALPALTEIEGVLSTPMVKLVSRTRVEPERKLQAAAVGDGAGGRRRVDGAAGDREGDALDPALAGVISCDPHAEALQGLGRAGVELEGGRAAGELDRGGTGGRGDGERHEGAGGRQAEDARESGHARSSEGGRPFG